MDSKMDENLKATEWDRDNLMKARWLVGCQEAKEGTCRKSLIRQIVIPDEWLNEEEPEHSRGHGTKELRSSRGTGHAERAERATERPVTEPPTVVPPAPKTAGGANDGSSGPKDSKAWVVKVGDENESHGAKTHSDGSTGASSPFDTSSNSSKESSPTDVAKGRSGSSSRNVINISSCITGDRGKTISLDASITPVARHRAPTAEEEATAALSAMLGLGKPKVPLKPTPPPRTHLHWNMSSADSSGSQEQAPRPGLNPNAAEFRPCSWSYDYDYDYIPPPPPEESDEAPEMSNLLGVNLLDEIWGGGPGPAAQRIDDDEAA